MSDMRKEEDNADTSDTKTPATPTLDTSDTNEEPPATKLEVVRPTKDELLKVAQSLLKPEDGLSAEDLLSEETFVETVLIPKWGELQVEAEKKAEADKKARIARVAQRVQAEKKAKESAERHARAAKAVQKRNAKKQDAKDQKKTSSAPKLVLPEVMEDHIKREKGAAVLPPKLAFLDKVTCYILFMLLHAKLKVKFLYDGDQPAEAEVYKSWNSSLRDHMRVVSSILASVHGQTKDSPRLQIANFNQELQNMEKAILDLEDGEGETVGYDSAKYVRFMVSRGPHEGVDEIKKMEALQRKVEKAAEAAELEEKSGDGQTEEEKASAVKRRALIEAISEKLGGKSFEKLAKNVVSKMASKTGNLDFSPEDALLESALRKLRAGAEPGDEMVILLTNASGYEMADAISLFQEERKALDEAQEAQTELARKAKARIPVEGKRSGKKGKPTGKKEKGNKKGR